MINPRLIKLSQKSMVHVKMIVASQIISMLANVLLIFRVGEHLDEVYTGRDVDYMRTIFVFLSVMLVRSTLKKIIAKQGSLAASGVKIKLRQQIYEKMLRVKGSSGQSTAEKVQISSEGVEQLEMYFASYLPQFFYCMLAPLILFFILSTISFKASVVLFLCVPLIPVSIMIVQKIAKKLLWKYWSLYADLGDSFLENLQGMTTLKIYGADQAYHEDMNKNAQHFRKITMKVLSMQLNSIIIMDIIAYGGAALGGIMAVSELQSGSVSMSGAVVIILLASEFFLPMRLLGSFFHIAMNGMAASKKIFALLDLEEEGCGTVTLAEEISEISFENLSFSYENGKEILSNISFTAGIGLTSIVGVSGSGKSTITSLIMKKTIGYQGEIQVSGVNLEEIQEKSLYQSITRLTDKGYLFEGSLRDNLLMAKESATEEELISVLTQANIWDLFQNQQGLDTKIAERGANFSGGEKQRINIARALLTDSPVYIFDEVTSNIDVESEDDIMDVILSLSQEKIVLLISHRLQNVVSSNKIILLEEGKIKEEGTQEELMAKQGSYATLFQTQADLEQVKGGC